MPQFSPAALREFVTCLFVAAGAGADEGGKVATSLVESNLCGHDSHGVILARWYLGQIRNGELKPGARFTVAHESASFVSADGNLGFGQVQCPRLIDRLVEKARATGVACGAMRRSGHVGRLGEWVERAATNGLAALMAVNDNGVIRTVVPPGGLEPRISTNPVAIAVPTGKGPLVLDISTSAVANGKLKIARLSKQPVPLGWIQDAKGEPTTDPNVMQQSPSGALLPFGGDQAYKGFGLGVMFDILVAGLSGGYCPPAPGDTPEWNNVLAVVWDPARCAGLEHFQAEADKLIASIRDTPTRPGVDRIRLPGDRSAEVKARRLAAGITLEGDHWETLAHIAGKLSVALPEPCEV